MLPVSQKKTNCYPLTHWPPHLKNVTALPCNFFIRQKVMLHSTTLCKIRNKVLPKLVHIADWYSIHAPLWVLQYPNLAIPSSSSLSKKQKPTDSIIEMCCWHRSCYQWSAALLETFLSSRKTMQQHIMLVTESRQHYLQSDENILHFTR